MSPMWGGAGPNHMCPHGNAHTASGGPPSGRGPHSPPPKPTWWHGQLPLPQRTQHQSAQQTPLPLGAKGTWPWAPAPTVGTHCSATGPPLRLPSWPLGYPPCGAPMPLGLNVLLSGLEPQLLEAPTAACTPFGTAAREPITAPRAGPTPAPTPVFVPPPGGLSENPLLHG